MHVPSNRFDRDNPPCAEGRGARRDGRRLVWDGPVALSERAR